MIPSHSSGVETDGETEAERGDVTQLVDGRAGFKPRPSGSSLVGNPCPVLPHKHRGTEGNTRGLVLVKNLGGGRFRQVALSPPASLEGCEGAGLAKGIPGPEQWVGAPTVGKNLGEIEGQWGGHHS